MDCKKGEPSAVEVYVKRGHTEDNSEGLLVNFASSSQRYSVSGMRRQWAFHGHWGICEKLLRQFHTDWHHIRGLLVAWDQSGPVLWRK